MCQSSSRKSANLWWLIRKFLWGPSQQIAYPQICVPDQDPHWFASNIFFYLRKNILDDEMPKLSKKPKVVFKFEWEHLKPIFVIRIKIVYLRICGMWSPQKIIVSANRKKDMVHTLQIHHMPHLRKVRKSFNKLVRNLADLRFAEFAIAFHEEHCIFTPYWDNASVSLPLRFITVYRKALLLCIGMQLGVVTGRGDDYSRLLATISNSWRRVDWKLMRTADEDW